MLDDPNTPKPLYLIHQLMNKLTISLPWFTKEIILFMQPPTKQGDQIGRLCACWVIVYFGQCF
jgi:hypothetical protein